MYKSDTSSSTEHIQKEHSLYIQAVQAQGQSPRTAVAHQIICSGDENRMGAATGHP